MNPEQKGPDQEVVFEQSLDAMGSGTVSRTPEETHEAAEQMRRVAAMEIDSIPVPPAKVVEEDTENK